MSTQKNLCVTNFTKVVVVLFAQHTIPDDDTFRVLEKMHVSASWIRI